MKRILFIILSLFVIWTAEANDIYEVTATRLNVRVSPSTTASVIGGVSKGTQLEVIDINSAGWAKIEFKNRQCYVSSKFLRFVRTIDTKPIETPIIQEQLIEEQEEEQATTIETIVEKTVRQSRTDEFHTLLNGPGSISDNFELYYGLSAGVGYSSFMWDGELASGKTT